MTNHVLSLSSSRTTLWFANQFFSWNVQGLFWALPAATGRGLEHTFDYRVRQKGSWLPLQCLQVSYITKAEHWWLQSCLKLFVWPSPNRRKHCLSLLEFNCTVWLCGTTPLGICANSLFPLSHGCRRKRVAAYCRNAENWCYFVCLSSINSRAQISNPENNYKWDNVVLVFTLLYCLVMNKMRTTGVMTG